MEQNEFGAEHSPDSFEFKDIDLSEIPGLSIFKRALEIALIGEMHLVLRFVGTTAQKLGERYPMWAPDILEHAVQGLAEKISAVDFGFEILFQDKPLNLPKTIYTFQNRPSIEVKFFEDADGLWGQADYNRIGAAEASAYFLARVQMGRSILQHDVGVDEISAESIIHMWALRQGMNKPQFEQAKKAVLDIAIHIARANNAGLPRHRKITIGAAEVAEAIQLFPV